MPAYTADEIAGIRHTLANGPDQDRKLVLAHLDAVPVEHRPTLGPPPREVASDIPASDETFHRDGAQLAQVGSQDGKPPATAPADAGPGEGRTFRIGGSFEDFQRLLEEDRQRQAAEQAASGTGGHAMAPATEPDPGSPEYQAAAAEARKLDARAWENLGFLGQVGVAFERFDQEGRQRGAAFNADSAARRLQTVLDLQRRQEAGEALNVTEKKYLLRNRNVASELAGAVGRLTEARQHLDSLPASDPLRRLFEASSVAEAASLLREHPGAIARAIGVESLPALTVSLIAMAALGPIGGGIALTGTGGLEGYAKGLVGALARAGVDVSDADDLTRALQDKALMERVRKDATTDGAIEAGITIASMMIGVRRARPKTTGVLKPAASAEKPALATAKGKVTNVFAADELGRGYLTFRDFKKIEGHAGIGYEWHHIVGQTAANIERFDAKQIHSTKNLVRLPQELHRRISGHYSSKPFFAGGETVRDWLGKQSFAEQAVYGRKIIKEFGKAEK